jgi:hypothetical protein
VHGRDILLILLFLAVVPGPVIWRLARRVPTHDLKAIHGYLSARSQTVERVRPLVIGGPWKLQFPPYQYGRPYRVVGREPDGSRWVHIVALVAEKTTGAPALRERVDGIWRPPAGI